MKEKVIEEIDSIFHGELNESVIDIITQKILGLENDDQYDVIIHILDIHYILSETSYKNDIVKAVVANELFIKHRDRFFEDSKEDDIEDEDQDDTDE